ncbi:SGNH/GDSL hydrolase family protein [Aquipuribacter sp. MA13-6]|uniref:SGNH/GDSL hydrolase family protein n=1 Tax=unclassified Aquipuribacter TaxID=2635084 RepID=UPI003EEDB8F3
MRQHPLPAGLAGLASVALAVWSVRLVQVQRSVARASRYWSQPRGDSGGLVYVALGDSAAQGVGATSPENGYVGRLAEQLRRATGEPVLVVNLSSSGAKVADVVDQQLPQVRALDADLVTVAVGGNDVIGYQRARFEADVARLVAGLPAGTFVADVPYFMHGHRETDSAQAAGIVRTAAQDAGLVVVPLNEELRGEGWSAMLTQTAADAFHPNDRGHAVWARTFWRTMSESGRPRRQASGDE